MLGDAAEANSCLSTPTNQTWRTASPLRLPLQRCNDGCVRIAPTGPGLRIAATVVRSLEMDLENYHPSSIALSGNIFGWRIIVLLICKERPQYFNLDSNSYMQSFAALVF